MTVGHRITDADTMESLALRYYGDANRWREIADYNRLQFPYLAPNVGDREQFYARGYVTVERANANSAATIKKGWSFKTKPDFFLGGLEKFYKATEDVVIPAGVSKVYVPIKAMFTGTFGNVLENMVTELGDDTASKSTIQFSAIYNEKPITGGQDAYIKVTGDIIYIPVDSTEIAPSDIEKMLELVGGEDLVLSDDGDIEFTSEGDIKTVSGAENIKQAVRARVITEVEELSAHPEYGTELAEIIGTPNIFSREKLAEIAILKSLGYESRIKDVVVKTVSISKASVYLDIFYKIAINNMDDRLQITM